ncbi:MAG: TAXI family TRAP transporter solute-binding subunit [Dehalococcoidia bacterium]|nr:TAXI family TRAP transporter solute-binding subunit [Dehalococcoidia bacterium]
MWARTALRLLLLVAVISSLLVGSTGCSSGETKITIFTGGTAGVYFPLGSKYAEMLNTHAENIDASAVTSGASVTNAKAIGTNECQVALLQNDVAYYALTGTTAMFDTAIPELMGLACLYPETIQFVVLADSPIQSLADLAGKNVAVGAPGSGTAVACEQILTAAGVWGSITRFDLNFAEAASAIKLGEVDAGIILAGAPTPAIEELAISSPVRIIDVPADILSKLLAAGYPFYVQQSLASGTYGMASDVTTVAVQAMFAVRSDLSEDVVYDMTRILFTELDELRTAHTKGNEVSLDTALDGMSLKLHPGAVKYYKEAGVNVPAGMM